MSRRGWWRTNALPLIALVIVAPLAVTNYLSLNLTDITNDVRDLDANEPTRFDDWRFGPVTLEPATGEFDAPPGTTPTLVTVRVDPGFTEVGCASMTVTDPTTGRIWGNAYATGWSVEDGQSESCALPGRLPFDWVAVVMLPDDAPRELRVGADVSLAGADATPTSRILELSFPVER